ncbi:cytochrome d ubiquinol oxidase subunit II [Sinosporangium siamense]|uniref:Cytochrome bd oxidase subunit II n=1 Tax=Sinosporangium siamense TaxID=1367973 RepID=A0A919RLX4_9ACTN|nr:cytochrome d ubiquinol oxidase subunit II [Sinosporangium siamense]GII96217.1 cytochrome bd oxidase subunit II [Sinosporangium siamense]
MAAQWYMITALFPAAYMALDGFVTGSALLHGRLGPGERARRATMTSFGPFFLAGEVWLVVTAAALLAVFPPMESSIFKSQFPILVVLVAAWLARDGAIWLRSRIEAAWWRRWWDRTLMLSGAGLAAATGLLFGNLLTGQADHSVAQPYLAWYAVPWAFAVVLLTALHGAAFQAARLPLDLAGRPMELVRRWAGPAAAAYVSVVLLGVATQAPMRTDGMAIWSIALQFAGMSALLMAQAVVGRRPRAALLLTGVPLTGLVLLTGLRLSPLAQASLAGENSLTLVQDMLTFALPAVLLAQGALWWFFMRRMNDRSVVFF